MKSKVTTYGRMKMKTTMKTMLVRRTAAMTISLGACSLGMVTPTWATIAAPGAAAGGAIESAMAASIVLAQAGPQGDEAASPPAEPEAAKETLLLGELKTIALDDVRDWTPEEFIEKIDGLNMPRIDHTRINDEEYRKEMNDLYNEIVPSKFDYIAAFFHLYPEHEAQERLLDARWNLLDRSPRRFLVPRETKAILEKYPESPAAEAAREWDFYIETLRVVGSARPDPEKLNTAVLSWALRHPRDDRTINILIEGAKKAIPGSNEQAEMLRRIIRNWPDHTLADLANGMLRRSESVGMPFELTFEDVRSGEKITMPEDTKGKVVAVFYLVSWAPYCRQYVLDTLGPLYELYHDKGFEVICVSVDESEENNGRTDLVSYLDERDIPFKAYYQGNAWTSEFSMSWGIYRAPDVMIVDQLGNLIEPFALDKTKTLVPELLGVPAPTEEEFKAAEEKFWNRRDAVKKKSEPDNLVETRSDAGGESGDQKTTSGDEPQKKDKTESTGSGQARGAETP